MFFAWTLSERMSLTPCNASNYLIKLIKEMSISQLSKLSIYSFLRQRKIIHSYEGMNFGNFAIITVVKELRSKMFRQHPGYYKAVFLKKTQTIIVSFYEYTVYTLYNVLNYDALLLLLLLLLLLSFFVQISLLFAV